MITPRSSHLGSAIRTISSSPMKVGSLSRRNWIFWVHEMPSLLILPRSDRYAQGNFLLRSPSAKLFPWKKRQMHLLSGQLIHGALESSWFRSTQSLENRRSCEPHISSRRQRHSGSKALRGASFVFPRPQAGCLCSSGASGRMPRQDTSPHSDHPIQGLNPSTHAPYCRDALAELLQLVPKLQV